MLTYKNLPARFDLQNWKGDNFDVSIYIEKVDPDTNIATPIDFLGWTGTMIFETPGTDDTLLTVGTATGEMTFPSLGVVQIKISPAVQEANFVLAKYDHRIRLVDTTAFGKTYFAGEFKYLFK